MLANQKGFFQSSRDSRSLSKPQTANMSRPVVKVFNAVMIRTRKKNNNPALSQLQTNSTFGSVNPKPSKTRDRIFEDVKKILRNSQMEKPMGPFNLKNIWNLQKENEFRDGQLSGQTLAGCESITEDRKFDEIEHRTSNSKDIFRLFKKHLIDNTRPNIFKLSEECSDGIQNYRTSFIKNFVGVNLHTSQVEKKVTDNFIL
jgi:hypothetical protein